MRANGGHLCMILHHVDMLIRNLVLNRSNSIFALRFRKPEIGE